MLLLILQDGSDIACVGVDTLNAETLEVISRFIRKHYSNYLDRVLSNKSIYVFCLLTSLLSYTSR